MRLAFRGLSPERAETKQNSEVYGFGVFDFQLGFHDFNRVRDLDRIAQGGVDRTILLFADLDRLADLFQVNAFTDGLITDMDLAETPGRGVILCTFSGHPQFMQVLSLLVEDFNHIIG